MKVGGHFVTYAYTTTAAHLLLSAPCHQVASMSQLRPLYGHSAIRSRLSNAIASNTLPASLLLAGPRGVGKQRLALWTAQALLCTSGTSELSASHELSENGDLLGAGGALPSGKHLVTGEPCGSCQQCKLALRVQHPDIHWFFPRPRLKDGDVQPHEIRADLSEVIGERIAAEGIWEPSSGTEGLFVATVHALLERASLRPAMGKRAVFIIGDAERMVAQEGNEHAANAFLKLLEEPPPTTVLILTSSESGSLLPTIKSRVVTVRVPPLAAHEMEEFLADPVVQRRLSGASLSELVARAKGKPGELFASESSSAITNARRMFEAALAPANAEGAAERIRIATKQGSWGARGSFSDILEALTSLLHDYMQRAVEAGATAQARRTSQTIVIVEQARMRAYGNVNPQLLTASLVEDMHRLLKA